jgi:nucleotide-binding universal stress UspA family protein
MLDINQILVPIDFTETSERALDYAVELAQKLGAKITVMHAYELPIYGFPDGALVASVDVATRISQASQEGLQAALDRRKDCGVEMRAILRDGPPADEIATVSEETGADLVVLGTHGRRGLRRAIMGSVAEEVIRACRCPVLTVHDPEEPSAKRHKARAAHHAGH